MRQMLFIFSSPALSRLRTKEVKKPSFPTETEAAWRWPTCDSHHVL